MPRHVFTAPVGLDMLTTLEGPLVYLNGAIQGTRNWQTDAITILGVLAPELHVASPRASSYAGGVEAHLAWEQAFMERAALNGVVLFMLTPETKHRCNRTYAAQMRFELGEWAVKSGAGLAQIVVGIERGFAGGSYLQRRFTLSHPRVPVCRTLQQTCAVASELTRATTYSRSLSELFSPQPFGGKNNG